MFSVSQSMHQQHNALINQPRDSGGIIAALLASGATPFNAAIGGAYLHAAAALSLNVDGGALAREIADAVPRCVSCVVLLS
jgi:hypothetical protein